MINDIEKLKEQHKVTIEKIRFLTDEINKLRVDEKKIKDEIFKIEMELNLSKLMEDAKKIDTDNLLSNEEIKEIYLGMDKSDYSECGYVTWLDLDKLAKKTIEIKNKYKLMNIILFKVELVRSLESFPPVNIYSLTFVTPDKLRFIIDSYH